MVDDAYDRGKAQAAFADACVPVLAAAKRVLAVVEVKFGVEAGIGRRLLVRQVELGEFRVAVAERRFPVTARIRRAALRISSGRRDAAGRWR